LTGTTDSLAKEEEVWEEETKAKGKTIKVE
jgi:hypothetical protein